MTPSDGLPDPSSSQVVQCGPSIHLLWKVERGGPGQASCEGPDLGTTCHGRKGEVVSERRMRVICTSDSMNQGPGSGVTARLLGHCQTKETPTGKPTLLLPRRVPTQPRTVRRESATTSPTSPSSNLLQGGRNESSQFVESQHTLCRVTGLGRVGAQHRTTIAAGISRA